MDSEIASADRHCVSSEDVFQDLLTTTRRFACLFREIHLVGVCLIIITKKMSHSAFTICITKHFEAKAISSLDRKKEKNARAVESETEKKLTRAFLTLSIQTRGFHVEAKLFGIM
jgi:hypothetical protein